MGYAGCDEFVLGGGSWERLCCGLTERGRVGDEMGRENGLKGGGEGGGGGKVVEGARWMVGEAFFPQYSIIDG